MSNPISRDGDNVKGVFTVPATVGEKAKVDYRLFPQPGVEPDILLLSARNWLQLSEDDWAMLFAYCKNDFGYAAPSDVDVYRRIDLSDSV